MIGLLERAILKALTLVFLAVIVVDNAQPMAFLSNRSITVVRYSHLFAVLIYLMSDKYPDFIFPPHGEFPVKPVFCYRIVMGRIGGHLNFF